MFITHGADRQSRIRNFAIIAHIDHGKSTLADRLLELTGTVGKRDMQEQILDSNPIERERGITIKLAPVRMIYKPQYTIHNTQQGLNKLDIGDCKLEIANSTYVLNLIDTPGHVDFSYEVSRSLAACEGAILVVDATQGVQAQTLAHLSQARQHKLAIIPVINKIDLPNGRTEETGKQLEGLGFKAQDIMRISAKTGENVEKLLEAIVELIPPPKGSVEGPLRALVFSSQYDPHKGVVVFVRIVDGFLRGPLAPLQGVPLQRCLRFLASGAEVVPLEVGYFSPRMVPAMALTTGEVGYIATGLKDAQMAKVGDTVTISNIKNKDQLTIQQFNNITITPLAGYKEPKPMVFLGLFPASADEYQGAREAMERLRLSDSAFSFRPISSLALGNGFHCGFLGLLHAEVVQERLLREFGLTILATAPSVEYRIRMLTGSRPVKGQGETLSAQAAADFPAPSVIEEIFEPVMTVHIYSPKRFVGAVMGLCQEKRGTYVDFRYLSGSDLRKDQGQTPGFTQLTYLVPLAEMIVDFFDRLKSVTEGYASLDYEFFDFQPVKLMKVDILVNKEKVDALSFLAVADQAQFRARTIVEKLAAVIPRSQFEIPVQASIGGKVIARADVKAFRKDVTQKLYGGDRTRKDKLLEAQKKGKAKMKMIGRVEIPQEAFFMVLKPR